LLAALLQVLSLVVAMGCMLDWHHELNATERRTFWACFGGW
jgi:hypothetical protein